MRNLPESYCLDCAKERPEEFAFIREAETKGSIVFTGHCARHALAFFGGQPGVENVRLEDGKIHAEIGGRTFVGGDLLPDTGMEWGSL